MRLLLLLLPASLLLAEAPALGGTIRIAAYDAQGRQLDLEGLLRHIGRADGKNSRDPKQAPIAVLNDGIPIQAKPRLSQKGADVLLSWDKPARASLSLPWPVAEDGFSTVLIDKEGSGFSDGDVVFLNEQIASTQYRLLRDSLRKHSTEMQPPYKQDAKSRKKAQEAKDFMAAALAVKEPAARAAAFDKALRATSLAWQTLLIEHGTQIARAQKKAGDLRFAVTLDESLLDRLNHFRWLIAALERSGTNWVRLVFRANPGDFAYARLGSFNDYDEIVSELRRRGLKVMGCVLDTAQWPGGLTPETYSERVKNLVLHYKDQIRSWEVGSEINGDWLGGRKDPLPLDRIYRIYSAAADTVKEIDPELETAATLYWWEGTAPDGEHSTLGWLRRRRREGFGRNLDVLGLSLQVDDNPVGMALEPLFERVHRELPDKNLMISSLGYVEGDSLKGYDWLDAQDVWSARSDLVLFLTPASCAMPRSLCGGFWWQALDQMLPGNRKTTPLFSDHAKALEQLGR